MPPTAGGCGGRIQSVAGSTYHRPALLAESLHYLALRPGARIVDGTIGGGGHAAAILDQIGPTGSLIGLDVDAEALAASRRRLAHHGDRLQLIRSSFREIEAAVEACGGGRVEGVLLDLGVSSRQLDDPVRGFRFAPESAEETPLDMRMDQRLEQSARDLLARATVRDLSRWFRDYGELPAAERLARVIAEQRRRQPLRSAADLLRAVEVAGVGRGRRHHPATLVFQALRIAVNDELRTLAAGLSGAVSVLAPAGRLVVIAYHSLEDRTAKQHFRDEARGCICPPRQPVCTCGRVARLRVITTRPVRASESETAGNPRARSARLRAAERLPEAA